MTDDPTDYIHIVPINDLKEHDLDADMCWCQPMLEADGDSILVIHTTADGREIIH